jgi:hypothetical protein
MKMMITAKAARGMAAGGKRAIVTGMLIPAIAPDAVSVVLTSSVPSLTRTCRTRQAADTGNAQTQA